MLRVCRTEIIYKDKELGRRVTAVKDFPSGEYLFMNGGKLVTERMFNYYLQRACREIGIPPRSTHKIRKTSKVIGQKMRKHLILLDI